MPNETNRYEGTFTASSDGGQFSTGTAALLKLAKALFYLMTTIIVIMIIWFFTFGGAVIVDGTRETVLKLHFGKYQEKFTSGYHWCLPYHGETSTISSSPGLTSLTDIALLLI